VNRVFVDTSALYALFDAGDRVHARALRAFGRLRDREAILWTTSYVMVEAYALIGRRLGLGAVRRFRDDFAPLLDVLWVDGEVHEASLDLLLERRKASLSLVDAVSFVAMRREGIEEAFAFDGHFEEEGFTLTA
jgi:predicted nucleic acid-binding protein